VLRLLAKRFTTHQLVDDALDTRAVIPIGGGLTATLARLLDAALVRACDTMLTGNFGGGDG
jgi:hypothetical protein